MSALKGDGIIPQVCVMVHATDQVENHRANKGSVCPQGRVYNDTFNPPKKKGLDDVTDEPLEKRIDDTRAVFGARIDRYNKEAQPMLQYCKFTCHRSCVCTFRDIWVES